MTGIKNPRFFCNKKPPQQRRPFALNMQQ